MATEINIQELTEDDIAATDLPNKLNGNFGNLVQELISHIDNKENPHTVTAEQLGLTNAYVYKGSVVTYQDLLAIQNPENGWVYDVQQEDKELEIAAGSNFAWNGTSWDNLGGKMTGVVKTVNGNKPDNQGNVTIVIPEPEIATQAEAEAGTNNTKFMTPLRTQQAIEAQDGNPIVNATISGKVITLTKKDETKITLTTQDTNTSNWSVSKGTNGWARDNSTGFTYQWGFWKITKGGNISTTITFPRTFTSVYGATSNGQNSSANWYPANDSSAIVTSLTNSSITLRQSGDDQIISIYWAAWGIS